jgi:hypothetical protein
MSKPFWRVASAQPSLSTLYSDCIIAVDADGSVEADVLDEIARSGNGAAHFRVVAVIGRGQSAFVLKVRCFTATTTRPCGFRSGYCAIIVRRCSAPTLDTRFLASSTRSSWSSTRLALRNPWKSHSNAEGTAKCCDSCLATPIYAR